MNFAQKIRNRMNNKSLRGMAAHVKPKQDPATPLTWKRMAKIYRRVVQYHRLEVQAWEMKSDDLRREIDTLTQDRDRWRRIAEGVLD